MQTEREDGLNYTPTWIMQFDDFLFCFGLLVFCLGCEHRKLFFFEKKKESNTYMDFCLILC